MEDEALRGDITRLLTTGERVDPERRPQMIADCTDRLRLRRLEREIDDCQRGPRGRAFTLQEQVELATRLNQLYDQVERASAAAQREANPERALRQGPGKKRAGRMPPGRLLT